MDLLKKFLINELKLDIGERYELFERYNTLLLDWNTKINLVSRKSTSMESHIINSIFFLQKFKLEGNERVIDIGSGGGFPGIPLKIIYPELNITLVDSINKKVTVLNDVISKLDLRGINAVCGRAEALSVDRDHSHKYDIVTARSVAPLDELYTWNIDFLKKAGKMVYIKGGNIDSELSLLKKIYKKINWHLVNFNFPSEYGIEDKKLVVINK